MRSNKFRTKNLFFSGINAFWGYVKAYKTEQNLHTELAIILLFLVLNAVFRISLTGWAVYIVCTFGVLSAELVNTALEYLCNYVQPEYDDDIKNIKDIASAPVLMWGFAFFGLEGFFIIGKVLGYAA